MDAAHELGLHPETDAMAKDSMGYGYESKPRVKQWMKKRPKIILEMRILVQIEYQTTRHTASHPTYGAP